MDSRVSCPCQQNPVEHLVFFHLTEQEDEERIRRMKVGRVAPGLSSESINAVNWLSFLLCAKAEELREEAGGRSD